MATVVAAFGRGERRCAECRAGEPDECEFHEVVVHSAPSLSVCDLLSWFFEQDHLALTQSKEIVAAVSDRSRKNSILQVIVLSDGDCPQVYCDLAQARFHWR
jgi:hypothetical protein